MALNLSSVLKVHEISLVLASRQTLYNQITARLVVVL